MIRIVTWNKCQGGGQVEVCGERLDGVCCRPAAVCSDVADQDIENLSDTFGDGNITDTVNNCFDYNSRNLMEVRVMENGEVLGAYSETNLLSKGCVSNDKDCMLHRLRGLETIQNRI